jgi:hypothetical protein
MLLTFFMFVCCETDQRIYIKSISNNKINVNWFVLGMLSGYSFDYIEIMTNGKVIELFKDKYAVSDIFFVNDSVLTIQHYHETLETYPINLNLKIKTSETGCYLNSASSRIGRMISSENGLNRPHDQNSDFIGVCPDLH